MLQTGRAYSVGSGYRYGFNGQERSKEIHENSFTAEFWEYDSRIARRWNLDPLSNAMESRYSVFSGNPISLKDPDGSIPLPHKVKKGETLTSIAKKYGTSVTSLMQLNNIKHKDKIKAGQILTVGTQNNAAEVHIKYGSPETDFQNSVLTRYNNDNKQRYTVSNDETVQNLSLELASNAMVDIRIRENLVVVGGPLIEEIKNLPSVKAFIEAGITQITADKTLTVGEYYKLIYYIGSIFGKNGRRILWKSAKDIFFEDDLSSNEFFKAENWLGSYGFSMRVSNNDQIIIAVYDSKGTESGSDHNKTIEKILPKFQTAYHRYIWYINIGDIKNRFTVYEDD